MPDKKTDIQNISHRKNSQDKANISLIIINKNGKRKMTSSCKIKDLPENLIFNNKQIQSTIFQEER